MGFVLDERADVAGVVLVNSGGVGVFLAAWDCLWGGRDCN